jgi:hypothetical protein
MKIILLFLLLFMAVASCDLPSALTPTECLEFSPLIYDVNSDSDGYNVAIYHNDTEISSKRFAYSDIQKELVIEFNDNGSNSYHLLLSSDIKLLNICNYLQLQFFN